ncbi:4-hydroxyphenylpyruvate dioxygenase family protein [Leptolyngbya sp. PCC 6406]|uniref:4-hydroxyphenylpyruvate dioxygenase family protein n=1 Tax=Leptolyngbya sp. PCC 6406 TaxID=1173264 RepID=UPI0002AC05CE|nr:VOC family protein [Leptolyngbya sp. PCC 6406]
MDIDHLHLYVEDAGRWRDWFLNTLDFVPMPRGPGIVLPTLGVQGAGIRILLSEPNPRQPEVATYLRHYSSGVGDVAFRVPDVQRALATATQAGAVMTAPLQRFAQGYRCQVQGWGSLRHTLVEYVAPPLAPAPTEVRTAVIEQTGRQDPGPPLPSDLTPLAAEIGTWKIPWQSIDHVVLNVPDGELMATADWYEHCFGFQRQQSFAIATAQSSLRSLVLRHPQGSATLPINEPASANSQIQEFLDHHGGPGIQHAALKTRNLVRTVAALRQRGLSFLPVPATYHEGLRDRADFWAEAGDWRAIAEQQILVDWVPQAPKARLLQTFSDPLFDQPTFFLELIERQIHWEGQTQQQARGFGEGNFQALFEAIERQQQQRGSL